MLATIASYTITEHAAPFQGVSMLAYFSAIQHSLVPWQILRIHSSTRSQKFVHEIYTGCQDFTMFSGPPVLRTKAHLSLAIYLCEYGLVDLADGNVSTINDNLIRFLWCNSRQIPLEAVATEVL